MVLARSGHSVTLFEQDNVLFSRASSINQARLHTGLHYPRSLLTASESLGYYEEFRRRFPQAINDFQSVYAISRFNSKTSSDEFERFIGRLNVKSSKINVRKYFNEVLIESAYTVEEPTFDAELICLSLIQEISRMKNIEVRLGERVSSVSKGVSSYEIITLPFQRYDVEGVVFANYAGISTLITETFIDTPLPFNYELTEVLIGTSKLLGNDLGFTIMDGPFWSVMPYGKSGNLSLTSVGLTPRYSSKLHPSFPCQDERSDCNYGKIMDCSTCPVAPSNQSAHMIQQVKPFLRGSFDFEVKKILRTVKVTMETTSIDDARPTLINQIQNENIWYILSGKISTIFDLEGKLD